MTEDTVPAILGLAKIKKLAALAKHNDWHGSLASDTLNGIRSSALHVERNDEALDVIYRDNALHVCTYYLFEMEFPLHSASVARDKLRGWPDIIELFKLFPDVHKIDLVKTYRKLPFKWRHDEDDVILNQLVGHTIWWYSPMSQKIRNEYVLPPRTKSQVFNLRWVGHRRLFNFTTTDTGMRSVMLDSILKVG